MLRLASGTTTPTSGGGAGPAGGAVELAGSLTRQTEQDGVPLLAQASHVANIGRAVEDMEIKLRNLIGEVRRPSAPRAQACSSDSH